MSRIATPSEKIMAVAGTYKALGGELGWHRTPNGFTDAERTAMNIALLDAATRIALSTDTRDMGLLGSPMKTGFPDPDQRCDDCGMPYGAHDLSFEH